jgi:hypothetical protein
VRIDGVSVSISIHEEGVVLNVPSCEHLASWSIKKIGQMHSRLRAALLWQTWRLQSDGTRRETALGEMGFRLR